MQDAGKPFSDQLRDAGSTPVTAIRSRRSGQPRTPLVQATAEKAENP